MNQSHRLVESALVHAERHLSQDFSDIPVHVFSVAVNYKVELPTVNCFKREPLCVSSRDDADVVYDLCQVKLCL